MDGQRRIARPMKGARQEGRRLGRKGHSKGRVEAACTRLATRMAARSFAVLFLGASIISGGINADAFNYRGSPFLNLTDKTAGFFGFAAQDIKISGLSHHEAQAVLSHIGVKPGGSLVGFDAEEARILLESLDWIADADVQRAFPNRLDIALNEREPFAIWQIDGHYAVIDREGVEMSGLNPLSLRGLPLVSGKGANTAAVEYVNQMEAIPDVLKKVQAAARVGERRWTLYLDNGVKIALPERNVEAALKRVAALDASQDILSKGIREIDLRSESRMVIALAEAVDPKLVGDAAKSLSQVQPR